ncbi:hypothetical protein A3J15_03925 [Candidatus Roizmanbacteria bacterium RIFCSPLOWO2_02_FULL_38_10]|uniref:Methyltransferase type 11 domain-containing protein n=1 Tax=Candidatus Roizmanbacteria bacterium RIFCSPLOWO2_02_FULL_38_10 TaxID=1802074 RepID=A0A1F7JM58_9BACT|nr:MAG: hypothetical protein A3J15_03925 [Candidatus Roizmanbacteria bacterium RIFCSPLOWO2_02_FULL_38_10]
MKMIEQVCAICHKNDFDILYGANFDDSDINNSVFSARRLPDRIHYRIVKCRICQLTYSNPILDIKTLEKLYKRSDVTYDTHTVNLKRTYGYYLKLLEKYGVKKGNLLEIGCGNGFFLEEALSQGYKNVYGVEPGTASVKKARSDVRSNIKVDLFRPKLYPADFFDVCCCFQTLDHVTNPNELISECFRILKKKGLVLFYNHDVGFWLNRILGERSPIIDIEHTYLYDKKTFKTIFTRHAFEVKAVGHAFNYHNLNHWLKMTPLPTSMKKMLSLLLERFRFGRITIKLSAGNQYLIAQKK